jgi:hypothetical protein
MTTMNPSDWARGTRFLVIWCLPIALLLISARIAGHPQTVVWPTLLTWMGTASRVIAFCGLGNRLL